MHERHTPRGHRAEPRLTSPSAALRERALQVLRPDRGREPAVSRNGLKRASWNVIRAAILFAAVVALGLSRTNMPLPVYAAVMALVLGAVYVGGPRDSNLRWWGVYVLGFILFAQLRSGADNTGIPWQFDYVIALERVVGLGTVPTVWLQEHLYSDGEIRTLDTLMYAVYLSYFFVPHLVGVLVWRSNPSRFPFFVAVMLATYCGGLLFSFLLPTAPPWLAAENGHLPHVYKVTGYIVSGVSAEAYQASYQLVHSNPVAAMPSLHMAITAIVALFMWRRHWLVGVAGLLYATAMAFSLVYLGEHYVVDLLAGVLMAAAIWKLAHRAGEHAGEPAVTSPLAATSSHGS